MRAPSRSPRRSARTPGDLVLIVADADIHAPGGARRASASSWATGSSLVKDTNELSYLWVYSFPMYKWDADGKRWDATHNPFSGVDPGG